MRAGSRSNPAMLALPANQPLLHKLAATPVLRSEMPAGFTGTKVVTLAPDARFQTLGGVRLDFSNARTTESAGYALMRSNAAATRFAKTAARVNGGSLFQVRAVAVGRFAVAVTAATSAGASALLRLAVAHLKRSES
jgi:hypothetical protein